MNKQIWFLGVDDNMRIVAVSREASAHTPHRVELSAGMVPARGDTFIKVNR